MKTEKTCKKLNGAQTSKGRRSTDRDTDETQRANAGQGTDADNSERQNRLKSSSIEKD